MNNFNILLFICQLYLHKTEIKKKEYVNTNIDFWLLIWTEGNLGSLEKCNDNDNDVNYDEDLYITSSSYSLRPFDISEVSPILQLRKQDWTGQVTRRGKEQVDG